MSIRPLAAAGRLAERAEPRGLLLLLLFLLLPWGDGAMSADVLLTVQLLLLAALLLRPAMPPPGDSTRSLTLIGIALTGILLLGAVRVTWQVDPYGGLLVLINYLFFALFYLLHGSACRRSREWAPLALHWMLAGILLAAAWGLAEQVLQDPGRVSGPFRDPNHLASLLTVGASLVLARLVFGAPGGWRRRAWWLAGLAPLVWTLLLTGSRGGVLAFLAVLAAALAARRLVLLIVPLAVGAALLVIPNPFLSYLRSMASNDPYALERLGIWRSALEIIAHNPLGVGLGNYALYSAAYNFPVEHAVARYGRMPRQAHNILLQLTAEGGWLVAIPLVLLFAALGVALFRWRRGLDGGGDPVAGGALLGLLGLGVQAMVSKNLGNNVLCFCMLFLLAVLGPLSPRLAVKWPCGPLSGALRRGLMLAAVAVVGWFAVWVPWHADRLSREAGQCLADGDAAGAAALLDRASRAVPIQSHYLARRAEIQGAQFRLTGDPGRFASAVRLYDEARRWNPREPSFLLERAALHLHLARSRPGGAAAEARAVARTDFRAALRLVPHQYAVHERLAGMALEEGDRQGAMDHLRRAVADEPNFIRGRLLLARLLEQAGRTGEAAEQRREAAERRQRYPRPRPGWGGYELELLRPGPGSEPSQAGTHIGGGRGR